MLMTSHIGTIPTIVPIWLTFKVACLTSADRSVIDSGSMLTDLHINIGQELIKRQFPHVSGL